MSNKAKTLSILLLLVAFLGMAYVAYNSLSDRYKPVPEAPTVNTDNPTTGKEEDYPAPDFTVYDAEGKEVKLSDFKGKPVVINFWASWCPPCKEEMPYFNEVYKIEKDNVQFLMIDMVDGQRETIEKGQEYVDAEGFEFPIYFDTESDAAYNYGISSIPTTVFIDAEGNLITGYKGAIDKAALTAGIDKIRR